MLIEWKITEADVDVVNAALQRAAHTDIVKLRKLMIENRPTRPISKELFWERLVISRLTTQVRITPNGALASLPRGQDFPFKIDVISRMRSTKRLIKIMSDHRVGRDRETAAGQFIKNAKWLVNGGWNEICPKLKSLIATHGYDAERKVAEFLRTKLCGIGPKQARNLLQALGLIFFETPIDSRVTKWLNDELGFPLVVTPQALADPAVYHLILDGLRALCERAGILPTLLDAAVFGE